MTFPSPPGVSKYRHVAATLRERIKSGTLPPGATLPSETELEKEFGFTRGTIRQAISLLRQEGLLDVVHGRGTFIRSRRLIRRDIAEGLRQERLHVGKDVPRGDLFASMTDTK